MPERDFSSTATIACLKQRAAILKQVRAFFDEQGFWEVETPLLSADTVVDRHIEPVGVVDENLSDAALWLQTSPEFGMKRLLASGADAIFQIGKCFRSGESGALHNPEFTMVEWYRVGDSYDDGMNLLGEFAMTMFARGRAQRLSYHAAFEGALNLNPHTASVEQLASTARGRQLGVGRTFSDDRDDWLDLLLTSCIQPTLGVETPTILYDYPASQAALAKVRTVDQIAVAERFELFVEGVELANGYYELCDGAELRRRNAAVNVQRAADGKRPLTENSRLLDAMDAGLPACCGCALGLDRLVMLRLGVDSIDQVIPFPTPRA